LPQGRSYHDKRVAIKLQVNFGEERLDNMGFTDDISANGIFIKTAVVYPSESELGIELILPDGDIVRLKGLVNWSKGVAPNLVWATKDAGMGVKIVKFVQGRDLYYRLLVNSLASETQ
jgi:hypothetical protein